MNTTTRDDDARVTYHPFITDGRVGYRVEHDDGRWTFVYFNPSTGSDDDGPNVFVYQGEHNDPAQDDPITFVNVEGLDDADQGVDR